MNNSEIVDFVLKLIQNSETSYDLAINLAKVISSSIAVTRGLSLSTEAQAELVGATVWAVLSAHPEIDPEIRAAIQKGFDHVKAA